MTATVPGLDSNGDGYLFRAWIYSDVDGQPFEHDPLLRVLVASAVAVVRPGDAYVGLCDDNQIVRSLVLLTPQGCYKRDQGYWVPLAPDYDSSDTSTDQWDAYDTQPDVIPLWDSAQQTDGTMTLSDLIAS